LRALRHRAPRRRLPLILLLLLLLLLVQYTAMGSAKA
jgi:hypothetical protein